MRKINYPLIISDFDGTLVNADGSITEENRKAIADYVSAGGAFAVSTGRLPAGIISRVAELGLQGYVCCCQGAIVLDIQEKTPVVDGRLSLKSTLTACRAMEKMGLHIHAYDLWEFYSNMDDEALRTYERIVGATAQRVVDRPLSAFIEERGLRAYKLLAMVDAADSDAILSALEKEGIEGCSFTKSADFLIEVVNEGYSKGTAVEFLADHYGVPLEKTVAVGDQRNDMPMLERAGVGVAVQNAAPALKAVADYVSEYTNEESAIARVIEKFGFYGEDKI